MKYPFQYHNTVTILIETKEGDNDDENDDEKKKEEEQL